MGMGTLDRPLIDALAAMSVADWPQAQKLLANRLEHSGVHEHRRLNLFLLSIAAVSGGYQDLGNELWQKAQATAPDEPSVRYFDLQLEPDDPGHSTLFDLEKAWWDFNGWHESAPVASTIADSDAVIDWETVLEAIHSGDYSTIENRYRNRFADHTDEVGLLWNFLAIAYLQAGDVRTYNDMLSNRSVASEPESLPESLLETLRGRGADAAIASLKRGEWLTNTILFDSTEKFDDSLQELTPEEWEKGMLAGFYELFEQHFLDAARSFQKLNAVTPVSERYLIGMNAQVLSYFQMGNYTLCEEIHREFHDLLEANPIDPQSELLTKYHGWLTNLSVQLAPGQSFFDPFVRSDDTPTNSNNEVGLDLWDELPEIVEQLSRNDLFTAQRKLQTLELHVNSQLSPFESYLLLMMFLTAAVLSGDYSEVQQLQSEIAELEHAIEFDKERCQSAAELLMTNGFDKLAHRLSTNPNARSTPLDPWSDLVPL